MRTTLDRDNSKNKHISQLKRLYDINPRSFFSLLDLFLQHRWPIGDMIFSHNAEFPHFPDYKKIYTPFAFQPIYRFYLLDNIKTLSNTNVLQKYIEFITHNKHFSHILVITPNNTFTKIKERIEQFLPPQTDEVFYTIGIVSKSEFDIVYKNILKQAIKDTMKRLAFVA